MPNDVSQPMVISPLEDIISILKHGGELTIGPDKTDYKTLYNMLPHVADDNKTDCHGSGHRTHYSVSVHTNGSGRYLSCVEQPEDMLRLLGTCEKRGRYILEVCLEEDRTIHVKMKDSPGKYADSFGSFLAANH